AQRHYLHGPACFSTGATHASGHRRFGHQHLAHSPAVTARDQGATGPRINTDETRMGENPKSVQMVYFLMPGAPSPSQFIRVRPGQAPFLIHVSSVLIRG